jgi:hypothetical protein
MHIRNRRAIAALQRLGQLAGTGLVLAGAERLPAGLTPAQHAMAIAEKGDQALSFMIETASGGKDRTANKV